MTERRTWDGSYSHQHPPPDARGLINTGNLSIGDTYAYGETHTEGNSLIQTATRGIAQNPGQAWYRAKLTTQSAPPAKRGEPGAASRYPW